MGKGTGGIFLIFLGIVFLLINCGLVPAEIWAYIWRLWPVLLILWGGQIMLGSGRATGVVMGILTAAVLAGALIWGIIQVNPMLPEQWVWDKIPLFEAIKNLNSQ